MQKDPPQEDRSSLHALADDLCVLAYDIETGADANDLALARRARSLCHELRSVAGLHPRGPAAETFDVYVEELVRRARAMLASSDSQPPAPSSNRTSRTESGTRPRITELTFDDDPPTSPGAPRAIRAEAGRSMVAQ